MTDIITPKSFDGFSINDTVYMSGFAPDTEAFIRTVDPIVVETDGGYATIEGFNHKSNSFYLWVSPKNTTTIQVIDDLKQAFRVGKIAVFIADFDGQDRARRVIVEGFYPHATAYDRFVVRFTAADPRWYDPLGQLVNATITADGQGFDVENTGDAVVTNAIFRFTPTVQKDASVAPPYMRYANIVNRVEAPLNDWPIDITNGGINHAGSSYYGGGKSLINGNDITILENGQVIVRFFGEHATTVPNASNTKIWVRPRWQRAQISALLNAITATVPANGGSLLVAKGTGKNWDRQGYLQIASTGEIIFYDGYLDDNEDGYSEFQNIKRGQWGTAGAIASANAVIYHAQKKIQMVYGWTNAPAPEARPDLKPLLKLGSSTLTNLQHEWSDIYDDLYPNRWAQWTRSLEARDSQSNFLWLPSAPSGAAANADFSYIYGQTPGAKDNFNILRRDIPVGTSGASGQFAFTRVIDYTMMAWPFGVRDTGVEEYIEKLIGPLTSATWSAPSGNKYRKVGIYVRSGVVLSSPEIDNFPMSLGAFSNTTQVSATNAGGSLSQLIQNTATKAQIIYALYLMLSEPSTPKTNVSVWLLADDGSGAPVVTDIISQIGVLSAAIQSFGFWNGGLLTFPFPLLPDTLLHMYASVAAGTHSSVLWWDLDAIYQKLFPIHAFRLIGDGEIDPDARAELNDNATFDDIVIKLDSAGVPSFSLLSAEKQNYWMNHTLENTTTLQSLTFNLHIENGQTIEVNTGTRKVKNLDTGEEGLIYAVSPTDKNQWINLAPSTNQFLWHENGVAGVDVEVEFEPVFE